MKEEVLLPSLQIRRVLINPSKRDKEFASMKYVTYIYALGTLRKNVFETIEQFILIGVLNHRLKFGDKIFEYNS